MAHIAVLGLGAMGSRMARRLLAADHAVTVWNRSAGAVAPLTEAGALAAATPRAAVAGVDFAIAMVRDDAASREVWLDDGSGALAGLPDGAVAIESSTVTVAWARALAEAVAARGRAFLDAPVVGSRPQAEAGRLIYLVGGDAAVLERARPVLAAMGSVHRAGDAGVGAAMKLMVNAMLGAQVTALAEALAVATREGVDRARAAELFGEMPVCGPAAKLALGSMLSGDFTPNFPVALIEKDFGYALASGGELPVLEAVRSVFRTAMERGLGELHMTGVAKLYE